MHKAGSSHLDALLIHIPLYSLQNGLQVLHGQVSVSVQIVHPKSNCKSDLTLTRCQKHGWLKLLISGSLIDLCILMSHEKQTYTSLQSLMTQL